MTRARVKTTLERDAGEPPSGFKSGEGHLVRLPFRKINSDCRAEPRPMQAEWVWGDLLGARDEEERTDSRNT